MVKIYAVISSITLFISFIGSSEYSAILNFQKVQVIEIKLVNFVKIERMSRIEFNAFIEIDASIGYG